MTTFSFGPVWKSEGGGMVGTPPREDNFSENSSRFDLASSLMKCLERRDGW